MRALLAAAGVAALMASPAVASTVQASVTLPNGTTSVGPNGSANATASRVSNTPSPGSGRAVVGRGTSVADLATRAVYSGLSISGANVTGTASGSSSLTDQITFNIAGATASTVTTISILFTTDFGYSLSGATFASVDYLATFTGGQVGGPTTTHSFTWNDTNTTGDPAVTNSPLFSKLIEYDVVGSTVTFAYSIGQTTDLVLTNGNSASTRGGGTRLTFNVPQSPIPEPATWAMMIAGFGLVGAAMRRRGATTVAA